MWLRLAVAVMCLCGCASTTYNMGIPNLYQVDACVWRSGQPLQRAQWETLKGLGITHVAKLNFESEGSDEGAREVGIIVQSFSIEPRGDLDVFDAFTHTFKRPDANIVAAADNYISQFAPVTPSTGTPMCPNGKVLVHCTHGQDRTGFAVGRYRVRVHHITKAAAYEDMKAHHFHSSLRGITNAWEDFTP
jgi:hypothetical protein